ncbi:hypothetical protein Agub_g1996, partial [Astrephomene gubernaculifera]
RYGGRGGYGMDEEEESEEEEGEGDAGRENSGGESEDEESEEEGEDAGDRQKEEGGGAATAAGVLMLAVGTSGQLGGVWRSPPLALSEFSTHPAEALNPHCLAGMRALLRRGEAAHGCLGAAVRAQVLRAVALEVSVRHNQVLLDGIIRKLDRRRRVLLWRAAAMEGVMDEQAMDVVVGGPPGEYAPALRTAVPPFFPASAATPSSTPAPPGPRGGGRGSEVRLVPPLLREPPGERIEEYRKQRRTSSSAAALRASRSQPVVALLDEAAREDLRARRRALTAAAGALYLDVFEIKLRLRVQARRSYVQGLLRLKGSGSGTEVEAAVRADTESQYAASFLSELLPAAARTQLAGAVRELAVLVLGGTGGYGADWGLQYDAEGQLLVPAREDRGPLFQGVEGQAALRAAVLEYAPMWQGIMFQLADKKGDPDPMDWTPAAPAAGLPTAIGFLQTAAPSTSTSSSPSSSAPATAVAAGPAAAAAAAAAAASQPQPQQSLPQQQQQQQTAGATTTTTTTTTNSSSSNSAKPGSTSTTTTPSSPCLVRLDALWGLPGQWDVLHGAAVAYPPGPGGLAALEKGVAVAELVVEVVRHFMFAASLLAPSSVLARGGDVSGQTAGLAPLTRAGVAQSSPLSYSAAPATGQQLVQQSEVRVSAASCSFLPGALLAADLVKLQARLQFLHRPPLGPGYRPGAGGSAQPRPTQPADDVISALRRELRLLAGCRVMAAARVRDGLLAGGAAKRHAWYLTGALEYLLARTAARVPSPADSPASAAGGPACPPAPGLPLGPAACLRLPDPDRLALHNELGRLGLALEACLGACRLPDATAPHDVMAIREYFAAGMWVHDRLRDALCWRSLLMESPSSFPFVPPHPGAYLRRYHSPALPLAPSLHPPHPTVGALQRLYDSKVAEQARMLVSEAEALQAARSAARSAGVQPEEEGGAKEGEGKPAWLAASPAWACAEVRLLECCCVVSKQLLDLQAVQVALLRLHQDCLGLAGIHTVTQGPRASSSSFPPSAASSPSPFPADSLHPHSVPAAALAALARKLTA